MCNKFWCQYILFETPTDVPVVVGQNDVNPRGRLADGFGLVGPHHANGVCKGSGGVNHTLGLHFVLLTCNIQNIVYHLRQTDFKMQIKLDPLLQLNVWERFIRFFQNIFKKLIIEEVCINGVCYEFTIKQQIEILQNLRVYFATPKQPSSHRVNFRPPSMY